MIEAITLKGMAELGISGVAVAALYFQHVAHKLSHAGLIHASEAINNNTAAQVTMTQKLDAYHKDIKQLVKATCKIAKNNGG